MPLNDTTAALRARMTEPRDDALRRLTEAETPDPSLMRIVADTAACLRVLDALDQEYHS